ncbi:energy transducer TonB [Sphingomonas psychrotolerans]|uniref:Energy transducer TonB n=1 Tax=Sphingomonas psychrotolerans TaxID=1327635 RepID=A0ABU3MXW9_9SPHN|nr:energy transducer TonB [Sphingomonas psychrotolerans]MDT8757159.1 energy transducer TonB [Sphingomonas psychrotolerans]
MFRSILSAVLVLVSGTASAIGAEKPPETLARATKWVVDYDRDACHLAAQFGEGKKSVIAKFTRYQPGDQFDLALIGDRFVSADAEVAGKIDFGLSNKPVDLNGLNGTMGKTKAIFLRSLRFDGWESSEKMEVAPTLTPEQEARITGVTVDLRGRPPFRIEFGSLAKPLAQMRLCMDNLVKSWGYDPVEQAGALRPASPITSPGTWLSSSDYPMNAVMNGHNGLVQFRLDIDSEGKVLGCFILSRTSPDDFADTTCRAMTRRARLQPALDAQGRPMRSYFVSKVVWLTGR